MSPGRAGDRAGELAGGAPRPVAPRASATAAGSSQEKRRRNVSYTLPVYSDSALTTTVPRPDDTPSSSPSCPQVNYSSKYHTVASSEHRRPDPSVLRQGA